MFGFPWSAWPLRGPSKLAILIGALLLGACSLDGAALELAAARGEEGVGLRAQMMPSMPSMPSLSFPAGSARASAQCSPPMRLCSATIKSLEQGAFLDFRARPEGTGALPRLLSPFAVINVDALDRGRCPAKLCAAHVALEGLLGGLLQEGYHTQSVSLYPGSVVMTLRTERIGRDTSVLKGSCRFNLDPKCVDSNVWLQEDQRSGEACGFAQTRVFVAATARPEFVDAVSFIPAEPPATGGVAALRLAAFDAARVHVYEVLYVHKICRDEMSLVHSG
jgi:hypothetical protein